LCELSILLIALAIDCNALHATHREKTASLSFALGTGALLRVLGEDGCLPDKCKERRIREARTRSPNLAFQYHSNDPTNSFPTNSCLVPNSSDIATSRSSTNNVPAKWLRLSRSRAPPGPYQALQYSRSASCWTSLAVDQISQRQISPRSAPLPLHRKIDGLVEAQKRA